MDKVSSFRGSGAARRSTRTLDGIQVQRHFYASADDLLAVFESVERRLQLRYTATETLEAPSPVSVTSGASLPTLSAPAPDDAAVAGHSYLVTLRETLVVPRNVMVLDSGVRYAFDQLANPDSISFTPGAWHSANVLLYGRVATSSTSATSRKLYGLFERAIAKHFRKVNAFWVGPEAEVAWRRGARLTIGASSPPEYDLREVVRDAV